MPKLNITLYDAFSDRVFGGNVAGVVTNASAISDAQMQTIASELAVAATGFVTAVEPDSVHVRFFSPRQEFSMCGHGVIAIMTALIEDAILQWHEEEQIQTKLSTGKSSIAVSITKNPNGRPMVMMNLDEPRFKSTSIQPDEIASLLGLAVDKISTDYPMEIAQADFKHLIVPIVDLSSMQNMQPNIVALETASREHDINTIAVFSQQTVHPNNTVHLRDFCPAVGAAEAAASGTTNGALIHYLIKQGIIKPANGKVMVNAEQGYELGRPSLICSQAIIENHKITEVKVGGVATKSLQGEICLEKL